MSKISVQFDTVSKDLDVTLDGEKVENVSYMTIYAYKEEGGNDVGSIELNTLVEVDGERMFRLTRIIADEKIVVSEESVAKKQLYKDIGEAIKPRFHKLP